MKSPVRSRRAKPAPTTIEPKKSAAITKFITLKPRVSEKGYALSEQRNTYIFDVDSRSNKFDIAQAVTEQYDVKVESVRISALPGKAIRSYRDRGRKSIKGQRSAIRKAYVTLQEGDKLPIFAAVEEPKAPEKETK